MSVCAACVMKILLLFCCYCLTLQHCFPLTLDNSSSDPPREGSWEGSKLTWKLVRIILDALEGCAARGAVIQSYLRHANAPPGRVASDSSSVEALFTVFGVDNSQSSAWTVLIFVVLMD